MEFFKTTTNINFMQQRKHAMLFSIILAILSTFFLITKGLNLGLDFTGGTQIELKSSQNIDLTQLRNKLYTNNFKEVVVQSYGSNLQAIIRIGDDLNTPPNQLKSTIANIIGPKITIVKLEFIGPQVGKTLLENGILAIIVALIVTMVYIAIRFEFKFAISAAISLIHDPVLILGIFAWLQLEFNLISLAALLTILGYSLNDTIVVYDRVRENFRLFQKKTAGDIVNLAINQTLSRTLITSGLTLIVVIALCLLGGETLRGFSIALIIGIIIGTYSSIYIAGSMAVMLGLNRTALLPKTDNDILQV